MSTLETLLTLTENFSRGEAITLHPERCLNSRFRAVGCSLCAEGCPAEGAITVANGKPSLDNEACLQCGLCLHRCPTTAFTRPDGWSTQLVKTVTTLSWPGKGPDEPVDLVCPLHPAPEVGPAPQAVQTRRCLAALSPATLLELSTLGREIWLDDTRCAMCPLNKVHRAISHAVVEANSWGSLVKKAAPIGLRTEQGEAPAGRQRPVYQADRPPISRRGLLASFQQMGEEFVASEEKVAMVKAGKLVPISERLPQAVPRQRARILALLEKSSIVNTFSGTPQSPISNLPISNLQLPISNYQSPIRSLERPNLPISNIHVNPTRCTACNLCARFCPTGALTFLSDGRSFAIAFQPALCLGQACHICVLACPERAVSPQPAAASPALFTKTALATGELTACQRCKQPIAQGPDLPKSCFACRPGQSLFQSWPFRPAT
jgi:ferredoxin